MAISFNDVWNKYCGHMAGTGGRSDYAQNLHEYASMLPPDAKILEVGTMQGASSICLISGTTGDNSHIYTIDPAMLSKDKIEAFRDRIISNGEVLFNWDSTYLPVRETLDKTEFKDKITLLPGFSEDVIKEWNQGVIFDMIFIDGCHQTEPFKKDMDWYDFLKVGGLLVCDDWIQPVEAGFNEWRGGLASSVYQDISVNGKYPKIFRKLR